MLRFGLFVVLCYLAAVYGQTVTFPNEVMDEPKSDPDTRTGLKYLGFQSFEEQKITRRNSNSASLILSSGYFLSLLSSTFTGYQGTQIQTPTGTTVQPMTSLPIFSAFPTMSPVVTNRTALPTLSTTVPPAKPNVLPGASPFPTALPTSFPTGLITSFGTFPPILSPQPAKPSTPLITTEGNLCGCLPLSVCVNSTTRSGVSVRIVTNPPEGITCPSNLVYCCAASLSHLCGLQNVIPGVNPAMGQANLGEFPWSAIILTDADEYVGGGALITDLHVITATHKIAAHGDGANLKVRFGDWDLSRATEPVSHMEVKVKSITSHANYDSVNLKNDISMITLASPVTTLTAPRPQINTICLPPPTENFIGSRCWVAGWGKDQFNGAYQQIIKKVDLSIIASDDCQTRLRQTRLGSSFVLDTKSFICAGGEANKDACTGDGGNALACERNGQFFIAGITVGGIQCGLANVPGLYTNAINFLPWINNIIKPPAGIDPRRKPS